MKTPEKKLVEPNEAGEFWEARVSEALNVPRKTLAKLRAKHLTEPLHFRRVENNAVVLTLEGLAIIEAQLAAPAQTAISGLPAPAAKETGGKLPPNAAAESKSALAPAALGKPAADVPAGPPKREGMTVDRLPQNTGLLLCVPKKRPVLTAVRVRDNTNFKPGMLIEAVQSGDGVWQFRNREPGDESTVGRLPRGKGRW